MSFDNFRIYAFLDKTRDLRYLVGSTIVNR